MFVRVYQGILALDYDVRHLEIFADSCGVSQLKFCFAELRDMVNLILSVDFQNNILSENEVPCL